MHQPATCSYADLFGLRSEVNSAQLRSYWEVIKANLSSISHRRGPRSENADFEPGKKDQLSHSQ